MVTLRRALLAAAPILAFVGCRAIAGYRDIGYVPASTVCNPWSLPAAGNGRLRLVNVAAVAGSTDFCIRATGTSSWGQSLFAEPALDCTAGLTYAQSTIPFAVQAGKVDVKAIPSGQTCAAIGTSEIDGVTVGDSVARGAPVVTVIRYAGGSSKEGLSALPEVVRSSVPSDEAAVRVVNALSGGRSIEWGFSSSTTLPATIDPIVVTVPIAPGATTPPSAPAAIGRIDSTGYAEYPPQPFNLGASYANDPTNAALTLYTLPPSVDVATFYVIGDPNDVTNLHPVTGLYCEDGESAAGSETSDAGSSDAGGVPATADEQLLAKCTLAPLSLLSVDLVHVSLYGADAPFEAQRRHYIYEDIAARTSDFVCVVEAGDVSDRNAIASAAKASNAQGPGQFQYSFMITTDLSTAPANPSDVTPPASSPPCGPSVVSQTSVDKIYGCVEQNCSTVSGGDPLGTGVLNGTSNCLSAACTLPFASLFTSPITGATTPQQIANDNCFDCTIYYFLSQASFATGQSNCTTQAVTPFFFGGQTASMILSHYPITSTASYILPSTGYRLAVLKAQVKLENESIDFFCGQLTSPLLDSELPYTGPGTYGSDVLLDGGLGNGWKDLQDLQAKEALAWIKQQTAADGLPAIVAFDLESDDANGSDAGIVSISPEVIDSFNGALTAAVPPGGAPPPCDLCPAPQNPYNSNSPPYEYLHTFLSGFPENATRTETLWGNDNGEVAIPANLPDDPAPPGGTGPLLEVWAHNYTILRP